MFRLFVLTLRQVDDFNYEIDFRYKGNISIFLFSFFYTLFGGIVICSMNSNDALYGDWVRWGWFLTFPVNIIGTAYRYTEANGGDYSVVIIIQIITFVLLYVALFSIKNSIIQRKKTKQ